MSQLLRTFIKGLILEMLEDRRELSELEKGRIRDELRKSKVFKLAGLNIENFVDRPENIKDWSSIFTNGSIKYLGSGRQGTAFMLGTDKILKLQPGAPRTAEIEDVLYSGSDVGEGLPNILSTGIFKSNIGPIGWSITEKVMDADKIGEDGDWKVLWRAISDGIQKIVKQEQQLIKDYEKALKKKETSQEDIAKMEDYAADMFGLSEMIPQKFVDRNPVNIIKMLLPLLPQDKLAAVEERYRLASDWFIKFIKGIQNHYKLGMVDFKPDNMGVRRLRGGEGEIVFFDAASAKLRGIKKWEP